MSASTATLRHLLAIQRQLALGMRLDPHNQRLFDQARAEGPYISTHFGRRFPLLAPEPSDVDIHEIAYALSHINRYTGHHGAYNDAQHSVLVGLECAEPLAGHLHDAHEAWYGDVSGPLKRLLPDYEIAEQIGHALIARTFGLPLDFERTPEVKRADLVLLATEVRDLAPDCLPLFPGLPEPRFPRIDIWPADVAEDAFLERFYELTGHAEQAATSI